MTEQNGVTLPGHDLSVEEAVAFLEFNAVLEQRITCGEPGCQDEAHRVLSGSRYIGSRMAGLGVDWNLAEAIKKVRGAARIYWLRSVSGHDLAVMPPFGRVVMFNVRCPDDVP